MRLLAIDTSSATMTVAVRMGDEIVAQRSVSGRMAHGEKLAPLIAETLDEAACVPADLTDVAVGVGPGPFTGLRVGVVTALTLAHTLGLRSHGLCSLDAIAAATTMDSPFAVATDARRKEVYFATYDQHGSRTSEPQVAAPSVLAERGMAVVGRGAELYREVLNHVEGPLDPSAAVIAMAATNERIEKFALQPLYLRRPDAVVPAALR